MTHRIGIHCGLCLVFALAFVCGCGSSKPRGVPLRFLQAPTLEKNPNPAVPLAAVLKFKLNRPSSVRVCIHRGRTDVISSIIEFDHVEDASAGLAVVGMKPSQTYQISIFARSGIYAVTEPETLTFTTPPLPTDPAEFPGIKTYASIKNRRLMEPGYTMFNPRRRIPDAGNSPEALRQRKFNKSFGMLLAIDASGDPVWYYRGDSRISDFDFLRNGNIMFVTQDNRLVEIDLLGNVVRQWYAKGRPEGAGEGIPVDTLTFHHSVKELPNGNFLILGTRRKQIEKYYTSESDEHAPRKTQWVMGDEVVEFAPDGKVVWRWNTFDHLDPYRIGYQTFAGYWSRRGWPGTLDWTHANSVSFIEKDNSILLNMRYQSAILKIDRDSGEILWIAGEPSGWPKTLESKLLKLKGAERWFWHQHAPEMTVRGTLMLFNNDNFRGRPFATPPAPPSAIRSHVAEYRIDEAARTITRIWSSSPAESRPFASWAMGSAQMLPQTGNVLAGFGLMFRADDLQKATWKTRLGFSGQTAIREYTHSPASEMIWRATLMPLTPESPIGWTLYGSRRIKTFYPTAGGKSR